MEPEPYKQRYRFRCAVTGRYAGPLFRDKQSARAFWKWFDGDPALLGTAFCPTTWEEAVRAWLADTGRSETEDVVDLRIPAQRRKRPPGEPPTPDAKRVRSSVRL
jgi:hypothetical protein